MSDPVQADRFAELLDAYERAVYRNGRVDGMDSLSAYHEEDKVDEAPPKAALLAYLHDIETRCDPAGEVQRMASLEEQVRGLESRLARQGEETDEDRDVLFEERTRLREVACCFASAIRSGESWTPTLEAMLERATAPWQEIARDLAARASTPEPSDA